ncbi:hypothetical protein L1276_000519 [Flavobacterium sp. HSC-32F16]|uniref:hypothetical protein n=1 Tax=Flavobacterium sp. HSC-32F16 TaxID=2910964 RepID=UPI0020A3D0BF|nr:hypothetical protein [Flavobacterium sp. HSC-32F16]MCP2025379.1 hypothetical protein [Flavobacterium sp. HSC-32F16]
MKNTKFTCILLLFLLFFIRSTESYKYHYEPESVENQFAYSPEDIPQFSSTDLQNKELQIHYVVKKKIKFRATTLDSSTLRPPYYSNLIKFRNYKRSLIYGIASIYQIQRHTYLHLYQLF